jgi:outer membrane protein assembly factor BamA
MRGILRLALLLALAAPPLCAAQSSEAEPLIIERFECRGNAATSCDFILSHIRLRAGERLDEEELQNARLRLTARPNFESVKIYLEKGSERGKARVVVEVSEARTLVTELAFGTSARSERTSQVISARVSELKLFGAGKVLDLTVAGRVPLGGDVHRGVFAEVRYVDPQLFGSSRYFFTGSVSYENSFFRDQDNEVRADNEQLALNLSFGRRLWDFSFLSLGLQYRPVLDRRIVDVQADGSLDVDEFTARTIGFLDFGWNTEDDPYFPTSGSRFHVGTGGWRWGKGEHQEEKLLRLTFRKTWRIDDESTWGIRIGGAPELEYRSPIGEDLGLAWQYARALHGHGIRRGRWYVDTGVGYLKYTEDEGFSTEFGVKAGVRLDTQRFGLVDLFVIGAVGWHARDDP